MCPDLKYIRLAKDLNDYHRQALVSCQARFRGSLNSMSFISLNCDTPQLGFSCSYTALENVGAVDIRLYYQKLTLLQPPQRPTPEKILQSYIIREAQEKGVFPFDFNIQLLTDEFAYAGGGTKLVLDLLGFNLVTKNLVIIELKSARTLAELVRQLNNAEDVIRREARFFQCLLKDSGTDWNESLKVEKIAIWPFAQTPRPKAFPEDIRELCYKRTEKGCGFEFTEKKL